MQKKRRGGKTIFHHCDPVTKIYFIDENNSLDQNSRGHFEMTVICHIEMSEVAVAHFEKIVIYHFEETDILYRKDS